MREDESSRGLGLSMFGRRGAEPEQQVETVLSCGSGPPRGACSAAAARVGPVPAPAPAPAPPRGTISVTLRTAWELGYYPHPTDAEPEPDHTTGPVAQYQGSESNNTGQHS